MHIYIYILILITIILTHINNNTNNNNHNNNNNNILLRDVRELAHHLEEELADVPVALFILLA